MNPEHARRIALDAQGLLRPGSFGRGLPGAQRALEAIGYVQIDTISVVARAHQHVLWSRVPGFRAEHLDALVAKRRAFEYWAHAAAYLPMRDYRFALTRMRSIKSGETHWIACRDTKLMAAVVDRIRAEGPLKARDFEAQRGKATGWWNWKPAKRALEQLYIQGDLMVTRREGFEKVYDLPERVLPADVDTTEPTAQEYARHRVESTLQAHGYASQTAFTYLRKGPAIRKSVARYLNEEIERGALTTRTLATGFKVYARPEVLDARPRKRNDNLRLLSPFDNVIIQRDRIRALFDYDYLLECYVKEDKRKFGYYCLPILYGDRFVGRLDAKAHRESGRFEVRSLHIERDIEDREHFLTRLRDQLTDYAAFNDCTQLVVARASPKSWLADARRILDT